MNIMKSNLRKHELIGLILVFISWTSLGYGVYIIMWAINRAIFYGGSEYLLHGKELLAIPLFFGSAAIFSALGHIELKEAVPGRYRR